MYGLLHLRNFTRPIISANNNACADGDSVEKTHHKENQASRGTDSGQSLASQKISHNEGIRRIIQLLEQIAQKKRYGKCYDFFPDRSFCHQCCLLCCFIHGCSCLRVVPCAYTCPACTHNSPRLCKKVVYIERY